MPTATTSTHIACERGAIGESRARPIDSLTSLRGFLAFWVVCYHFWKDIVTLFPSADVATPLVSQGHFAVPVFFVLSGYVLAYNYAGKLSAFGIGEYGRFLCMRAARIYPVHFVSLMVVLGMVFVCRVRGWPISDAGYGKRDFLLNLALAQTWVPHFELNWNYPSWSISSEWFAYLAFPFFCATVLRRITTRFRAGSLLGLCSVATIALYIWGNELPFRELIWVIPTFLAGTAVFACHSRGLRFRPLRSRNMPDFLLLALAVVPLVVSERVLAGLLLIGFLVIVYLLADLGSNCSRLWTNRFVTYLGELSYSLYMAHTLAQKVCYKLLPVNQYANSDVMSRFGVVLVYIAFIVFASLAMYYLVERPSRQRLRRLASQPAGVLAALRGSVRFRGQFSGSSVPVDATSTNVEPIRTS
jgi:peptidoglycan/LPS O-acetylase OafA/YrhL